MVFSDTSEILYESTFRTMNWTLSQQSQNSQDNLAGERKICLLCLFFFLVSWWYMCKQLPQCRFAGCTTDGHRTSAGWWRLTGLCRESVFCFSGGEGLSLISVFLYRFLSGMILLHWCFLLLSHIQHSSQEGTTRRLRSCAGGPCLIRACFPSDFRHVRIFLGLSNKFIQHPH